MLVQQLCNNLTKTATAPFRERGVIEALRSIYVTSFARIRERREGFDARFGTDTDRNLAPASLLARGDDVMPLWRYFGTLERPFRRIVGALDGPLEGRTFVDVGCGKGRALMLASDWPFRRIVGVELSPALVGIALRNIAIYRSATQRRTPFEVVRMDAAAWDPPLEDLVVYLFQPFPREVMTAMLENVERSIDRRPRRVTIAYYNSIYGDLVTRSGRFALRARGEPERKGDFQWAIYSNER